MKIGIIVDGKGDVKSLSKKYGSRVMVLKTDGPRGHFVSEDVLISNCRKQIRMLSDYSCSRVIILTDFESRTCTWEKFIENLNAEIKKNNFEVTVEVSSPNQMIENWYLADIEFLSKSFNFLRDNLSQKKYESKNGKKTLLSLMKYGNTYSETEHGPKLFEKIRETVAEKNSKSFRHFLGVFNKPKINAKK